MHCTYSQMDLDERRKIARWRSAKLSVDVIVEKLGRHRSTTFRELKRNQFIDDEVADLIGYYFYDCRPEIAQASLKATQSHPA